MRKILLATVLIIILSFTLTACGDDDDTLAGSTFQFVEYSDSTGIVMNQTEAFERLKNVYEENGWELKLNESDMNNYVVFEFLSGNKVKMTFMDSWFTNSDEANIDTYSYQKNGNSIKLTGDDMELMLDGNKLTVKTSDGATFILEKK